MSGIFGIFNRNGSPVSPEALQAMYDAMAYWGPDGGGTWLDGCCGLGQLLMYNTPEALYEKLPRCLPQQKLAFTAEARIDNREELHRLFNISSAEQATTPDSELILRAYLKWGEACADHLLGDWSFAVWHPRERRLFLARDHHGNTSLYFYADRNRFIFASSKKGLLALEQVPKKLNELRLAQILTSWSGDGIQTVHQGIERLPPAHTITVTPERQRKHRYWHLENVPPLRCKRSDDYVDGLREVFTEAVRCRLRSYRPVGATLSGGLDSGSVVAIAGELLGRRGKTLPTFSSVPAYDIKNTVSTSRFGDETPYIQATAAHVGNVETHLLNSAHVSPIAGIRRTLDILDAPTHAAGNMYWIVDILQNARQQGLGTLLTGQGGNASISWKGKPWMRPGTAPESLNSLKLRFKYDWVLPRLPEPVIGILTRARHRRRIQTWDHTAISPSFAERIDLEARREASSEGRTAQLLCRRDARSMRCAVIQPGRCVVGALWSEKGGAFQMEVRDPTLDKRVLAYTLAVPNNEYIGPNATDRYLLRRAMKGVLPARVLNATRRGRQSADLVMRLLSNADETETLLDRFKHNSLIKTYISAENIAELWQTYQQEDISMMQTHRAQTILTRGAMAGLFVDKLTRG